MFVILGNKDIITQLSNRIFKGLRHIEMKIFDEEMYDIPMCYFPRRGENTLDLLKTPQEVLKRCDFVVLVWRGHGVSPRSGSPAGCTKLKFDKSFLTSQIIDRKTMMSRSCSYLRGHSGENSLSKIELRWEVLKFPFRFLHGLSNREE